MNKKLMYTKKQIEEWKQKAEKWDALGKQIEDCYGKENENGEWQEHDENEDGLITIGEKAAIAFGWL